MRELKFRAFYKNKMWNVESIDWGHKFVDLRDNNGKGTGYYELENLMQFTGLHDKHGKEIYEGDIVEIDTYGVIKKVEIVFINGGFGFRNNTWDYWDDEFGYEMLGVVGNIYENPNLVEEIKS